MPSETIGRSANRGLAAIVAASILFSCKSVFFKLCYRYGTPPVVLQALRGMFSLPFYLFPFLVLKFRSAAFRPATMTRRDLLIIAWLGFSGYYLASIFDMVGLQYVTAGTERLILFIYPTLVVLFSAWMFRKRIPRNMLAPLLASYAGIALAFGGEADVAVPGARPMYGGFLVFLSAVFYALFLVGQGRMVRRLGPQRLAAGCMMASSACVFAQYLFCYPLGSLAQPAQVYWIAGLTSVFCNVVPVYLYGYGVHQVGAGKAAVVSSIGPVSTVALAGILLGERTGGFQLAGLGLVIAGSLRLGFARTKASPGQAEGVGSGADPDRSPASPAGSPVPPALAAATAPASGEGRGLA